MVKNCINWEFEKLIIKVAALYSKYICFHLTNSKKIDINLDANMKSTGEVFEINTKFKKEAYKGLIAAGYNCSTKGQILIDVSGISNSKLKKIINKLDLKFHYFQKKNLDTLEKMIANEKISYIISTSNTTNNKIQNIRKIDLILSLELSDLIIRIRILKNQIQKIVKC